MRKHHTIEKEAIETWLKAEAVDDDRAAERALSGLFQAMPYYDPGVDFADRVLARAGVGFSVAHVLSPGPRIKLATVCGLLIAGCLFMIGIPFWSYLLQTPVLRNLVPEQLLTLPFHAWADLVQHLTTYSNLWKVLADLWQAARLVLTSPPVFLFGALLIGLSLLSWHWIAGSGDAQRMDYA